MRFALPSRGVGKTGRRQLSTVELRELFYRIRGIDYETILNVLLTTTESSNADVTLVSSKWYQRPSSLFLAYAVSVS